MTCIFRSDGDFAVHVLPGLPRVEPPSRGGDEHRTTATDRRQPGHLHGPQDQTRRKYKPSSTRSPTWSSRSNKT